MSSLEQLTTQYREQLQEVCARNRQLGVCPFVDYEAAVVAHNVQHDQMTPDKALRRLERDTQRIGAVCTGELIDHGCWRDPGCPADPSEAIYLSSGDRRAIRRRERTSLS